MKWIEKMKQKQKHRQKLKEKEEKTAAAEEARRRSKGWRGMNQTGEEGEGEGEAAKAPPKLVRRSHDEPLKWQVVESVVGAPKHKASKKTIGVWCRPGMFHTFSVDDGVAEAPHMPEDVRKSILGDE